MTNHSYVTDESLYSFWRPLSSLWKNNCPSRRWTETDEDGREGFALQKQDVKTLLALDGM